MKTVPFILGPTGIGKTEISIKLLEKYPIEIISADSRQIYQYMDIGTAKPSPEILKKVKHHFIDHLNPSEYFSAGMFEREARKIISRLLKSDILPVVVGGSGFYIRALTDGLSEIAATDPEIRDQLLKKLDEVGIEKLYKELTTVDPDLSHQLKVKDKQRILRGLEVYYISGQPLSQLQLIKPAPPDFQSLLIGLNANRQFLYNKINRRVDEMISAGLVEEVRELQKKGYSEKDNALNTVGYKEIFEHFDGKHDFDTMVDRIKMNSRRYAKRQLTWFRRDKRIVWFNIDDYPDKDHVVKDILSLITNTLG
jgi:tRNA dimethylallyltransferase